MLGAVTLQVDVQALAFAVGTVIPILVGLLAKLRASSGVKACLNFFLSALAGGMVVAIQQNGHVDVGHIVIGMGSTWVVSVATYYGLLKPTGVTTAVQEATANVGIGKPVQRVA